ncbi:MAG: hypothetical protein H7Y89_17420 [Steroidobacteraceae bacterium]|nr:hypothetical protein [Steroidobacteraceae bacterium]
MKSRNGGPVEHLGRSMLVAGLLTCSFAAADPRPIVVEDSARLTSPDPTYTQFGRAVGVDGDSAILSSTRIAAEGRYLTAFLFRHDGIRWVPVRRLAEHLEDPGFRIPPAIAMRNGIAAVQGPNTDFYESSGATWMAMGAEIVTDGPGTSLRIDGQRVVSGEGTCQRNGRLFEKDSSNTWRAAALLEGFPEAGGCDNDLRGGPVDVAGDWAVVHQPAPEREFQPVRAALLFRRYDDGTGWNPFAYGSAEAPADATQFGEDVALKTGNGGDLLDVIVSGSAASGSYVFREQPGLGFRIADRIQTVDGYMGGGRARSIARSDALLFQSSFSYDRNADVVNVFRQRADRSYEHIAILAARNGESLGPALAASGNRVLVGGRADGTVHAFELPALMRRSPLQDTFATGNGIGWTPTAGSSFATLQSGASRVFRQSEMTGEARAVFDATDFTSQAIEADVRVNTFGASGSGAGLATRYQSPRNFFDVVVRNTGRVELRRMAGGTLRVLAATAFTPVAGRNYRLRLESVGTLHRVSIDGVLLVDADASGPTHGRAALVTDRAAADFDNVVVSPSLLSTIYSTGFEVGNTGPWKRSGLGFWNLWSGASVVWNQSSIAGYARASIGAPADDQIVRVRARLDTFATPNGSEDRWFGVMARHADERNFYYLSLRNSNTVSLRKFVNGAATTLATAAFNVEPATWYALRLDAVGNQLRGYVNGRLVLEASDTSHARGNSGPVMYKAAADYDDFLSIQP